MIPRPLAVALVVVAVFTPSPSRAEKIPPEFRSAFEGRVRPRGTYGVVIRKGVPTTSIYGVKGDQTDAYYSVDIKGGEWQASAGFFDLNQVAADVLVPGEVVEIVDVTYKDNRIDLRTVSLEAHKVTRGSGFDQTTKREPVSTNFKFFFPFGIASEKDIPRAMEYIETWVRTFPSEQGARVFAAQLLAGGGDVATAGSGPAEATAAATAPGGTRKEIRVGMTPLEVIEVLGKPEKEVSFETKSRWTYPDLNVIFENGRVKEVKF